MENVNVIKGNKLIAEFMGWSQQLDVEKRWYGAWFDQHKVRKAWSEFQGHEPLLFNESWDWLMPVVEKIENFNDGCTLCIIEDERCHINTQTNFEVDSVGYTKIEAVYNAIIEFIKWYNQQETKNNC